MTSYEPGTVAVATVRGVPNVRVYYRETHGDGDWAYSPEPDRGLNYSCDSVSAGVVTDIRPLVVLDLEDPAAAVEYLHVATDGFHNAAMGMEAWSGRDPLRQIAAQIKAQTKPPRIPEPGLFGIVEGWQRGEHPETDLSAFYLRQATEGDEDWTRTSDGKRFEWDEIALPILVREGVVS